MNEKILFGIIIFGCLFFFIAIILFFNFNMNDLSEEKEQLNLSLTLLNESKIINEQELNEKITQAEIKNEELSKREVIDFRPTLKQVEKVIQKNKINEVIYDEDNFNCAEYSFGLIQAFRDEKIYSCIVWLVFNDDTAHAIVAVETFDYGIIYIEPQDDNIITYGLDKNDNYCDVVNWDCDWKIEKIKSCFSEINYG